MLDFNEAVSLKPTDLGYHDGYMGVPKAVNDDPDYSAGYRLGRHDREEARKEGKLVLYVIGTVCAAVLGVSILCADALLWGAV